MSQIDMDPEEEEQTVTQSEKVMAILWPRLRSLLSGTCSGIAKCVVGHPFDTIKVRMQTEGYHGRFGNSVHTLTKTITEEGIFAVYKGASLPMVGWGVIDSFLWLGLMESRRQITHLRGYNDLSEFTLIEHFICGSIAGWTSTLAATPIEQIKARLQIQYADPSTKLYSGPLDCGKKLLKNNGFRGLYKGMSGSMIFRTYIGIYFLSYILWKDFYKKQLPNSFPVPLLNFISGGSAATVFWIFALPADCVKNRMMSQRDIHPRPYPNVLSCTKHIYKVEGFTGFYRGWIPCAIRSFPTNGAAFVAAEFALSILPEQLGYKRLI